MRIITKSMEERLARLKDVLPQSYVEATGSRPAEWLNAPQPSGIQRVTFEDPAMLVQEHDIPECRVQLVVIVTCGGIGCERRAFVPLDTYSPTWFRCPRCGVLSMMPEVRS